MGDPGSVPRLRRSPEEEHGNPLQYPCLENSMDRGAWWATVHGVAKSDNTFTSLHFIYPSVQFSRSSRIQLFATSWTAARQAALSITNSWSLLKLMSIESVMPPNHLILCHPLLLLPPIFPSLRVFTNQSVLRIRWPKYWSFSFSISPFNEYSGLISFRIGRLDLLVVQGTLKSLPKHHSSKASIKTIIFPQCSFLHTAIMTCVCTKSLQLCPTELWHSLPFFLDIIQPLGISAWGSLLVFACLKKICFYFHSCKVCHSRLKLPSISTSPS